MSRLNEYRSALLASNPDVPKEALLKELDSGTPQFASFIVDHGLGPLWHRRTERSEFHASRLAAEAFYLAQEHALKEIDAALEEAGIDYLVFKGAANRLLLYDNPAIRACHDLDLMVRREDRVRAATAMVETGFVAVPEARSIGRELVFTHGDVCIDLHWMLLREGRLRNEVTADMLSRRRRVGDLWMPGADDALFALLVHPAFAKHLAGWDMGLHRVMDVVEWLRTQEFDWRTVHNRLEQNGVQTAAWATLRWLELLSHPQTFPRLGEMMQDVCPGRLRKAWLNAWLCRNLPARTSEMHWARLLGFTMFLHDTACDSARAVAGRYRARRRSAADLGAFDGLLDQ